METTSLVSDKKIPLVLTKIIKRDGRTVDFDAELITNALKKCFGSLGADPKQLYEIYTTYTLFYISETLEISGCDIPTVEMVQDCVQRSLVTHNEATAVEHYITYRQKHHKQRRHRPIPPEVVKAFRTNSKHFETPSQEFQFITKYSRYNEEKGRRETWEETVDRCINFLRELSHNQLDDEVYHEIETAILRVEVMPSMRLLAMAGKAARRNNICMYNCGYLPVNSLTAFTEALTISMCGCGVGFSVERQYVDCLPLVKPQTGEIIQTFIVPDTAEGWTEALNTGLEMWFGGKDITFDYSKLRAAGEVLRTKGGQASGPKPLKYLLNYTREKILSRQNRKLTTLDAHDMMCVVGHAAISGGVRRTAMISLFDWDDQLMLHCKNGDLSKEMQRWNANNSAVWPARDLTQLEIMEFMMVMFKSERGEPGIFSRRSALLTRPERRKEAIFGTNPCSEVLLRPFQFCNLSSVILRRTDTITDVLRKQRLATIIGTIQSMATHFLGLREEWFKNCNEERLLGVDLNGEADFGFDRLTPDLLEKLKKLAIIVNNEYSRKLGINHSAAITCNKPSGNSSELANCSSGLHTRWSEFYIRNMRISAHDPVRKVLSDSGTPMDPENGQTRRGAVTWVVHFPIAAPCGSITREYHDVEAQLEVWLRNKIHYTEHNPSVTITYTPNDLITIVEWVYRNQMYIGGMAFLPRFDAKYDQMPYTTITREKYLELYQSFPNIDYSKLYRYEIRDHSTASQTLGCEGDKCIFSFRS